ncbi:MAG: heme exporter protein CcmD [Betaproteobacteria bacterium]|jgi:heme exporter protein D
MTWTTWSDFWAMGGYGLYVWGSLGVCALALIVEVMLLDHRRRASFQRIRNTEAGDGGEFGS